MSLNWPGEAEDVAAALYFASDEFRFTTGTELRIDGGLTAPLSLPPNFKLNRKE